MDLLDRYLAAVAALLPKAQREDIVAELRDILLNQMEEKEARLGRSLTEAEREAVLKAFGHPIAVAGRFGTPRSLIGPEVYPFYILGVKALLALAAFVTALPLVIALVTGDIDGADLLARFLSGFIATGLTLIGAATLLAAAIERGWIPLGRSLDWTVADLPRLDRGALGQPLAWTLPGLPPLRLGDGMKSRFEASLELAVILLFILWWTGAVPAPWSAGAAREGVFLSAAPIWTTLYLPILGLAILQVASCLVAILRPGAPRARAALELAGDLGGLAVAAALWSAGRLVQVAPQGADGPRAADIAHLQAVIDQNVQIGLLVSAAICFVKLVVDGWRLARGVPERRLLGV